MYDKKYLAHLYEIASHLNQEFSLPAALRKSLEMTVEALDLQTGWIWLVERDMKSVYLAASYNLPTSLRDYPERLSGWCYCIDRYFSDHIGEATNISEITCSRLKDLASGTQDLKFHATIPIIHAGQKIGLINLLTKERQQLNDQQLIILNEISGLIAIAIQRTRLQETYVKTQARTKSAIYDVLERVFLSRIEALLEVLQMSTPPVLEKGGQDRSLDEALKMTQGLKDQLNMLLAEKPNSTDDQNANQTFRYPSSPLTPREIEVLTLVRTGKTNGQIAEHLYIAERTVKFHMTSVLSKLHAKTRTQAVDIALSRGLISGGL